MQLTSLVATAFFAGSTLAGFTKPQCNSPSYPVADSEALRDIVILSQGRSAHFLPDTIECGHLTTPEDSSEAELVVCNHMRGKEAKIASAAIIDAATQILLGCRGSPFSGNITTDDGNWSVKLQAQTRNMESNSKKGGKKENDEEKEEKKDDKKKRSVVLF